MQYQVAVKHSGTVMLQHITPVGLQAWPVHYVDKICGALMARC